MPQLHIASTIHGCRTGAPFSKRTEHLHEGRGALQVRGARAGPGSALCTTSGIPGFPRPPSRTTGPGLGGSEIGKLFPGDVQYTVILEQVLSSRQVPGSLSPLAM